MLVAHSADKSYYHDSKKQVVCTLLECIYHYIEALTPTTPPTHEEEDKTSETNPEIPCR